ncbi:MAG TPA: sugar ABC transporter permease [Pyrinomonadaceae bacterium]|nr:sugar ABC transporter permease [Pyrinomonadaceae bacterium]
MKESAKSLLSGSSLRAYVMIVILAAIWGYFHWATGSIFLTPLNLSNLATQVSVTAILAVGMLMLIVSGNIDLSVGSVLGFAGGVAAICLENYQLGLPLSIAAAIFVGIAIGLLQGSLTAYFNIPAFIVTLGGLLAWRGAVKWLLGGYTVPVSDSNFSAIANNYIQPGIGWVLGTIAVLVIIFNALRYRKALKDYGLGNESLQVTLIKIALPSIAVLLFVYVMNSYRGIPVPVMILLAAALAGSFITNSTVFGRYLYAIGGNQEAARLSGIKIERNILKVYALLGGLTGVAALIFTARVGSAAPDAGVLKELDAIAACVIGGASLMGGRGTIFGACLGALIMASLDNGMSLLNVRDFMQDIIKGSILVLAVGLDMMGKKPS